MDRWLGASLLLAACYEGPADVDAVTTSGSTSDDVSTRGSSVASSEAASSGTATASTGDTASTSSSSGATSSSSESTGEPSDCTVTMVAGSTTQTIDVNGVERSYLVVVPQSLDGATSPAPVLMGFHGGNGTSEYASEAYGLAGDEPALYVYPQAPYWKEAGGVAWDVDPEGVDFPYFDAMLDDLAESYCVDEDRIFAAGQSNGAFFVNELGCRRSDVLRAIAPVAGGGPLYYPDCTGTITVMI